MSRDACPNPNRAGCPYIGRCYSDNHHTFWPKRDYKTATEKRFRTLPENQEQTCRWEHDQIHFEPIPVKPTLQEMRDAIAGIALEGYDDDEAA